MPWCYAIYSFFLVTPFFFFSSSSFKYEPHTIPSMSSCSVHRTLQVDPKTWCREAFLLFSSFKKIFLMLFIDSLRQSFLQFFWSPVYKPWKVPFLFEEMKSLYFIWRIESPFFYLKKLNFLFLFEEMESPFFIWRNEIPLFYLKKWKSLFLFEEIEFPFFIEEIESPFFIWRNEIPLFYLKN